MTTFAEFVDKYHVAIADAVLRDNEPIYGVEARHSNVIDISLLLRTAKLAQGDAIRAAVMSYLHGQVLTTIVGEMGTGKTTMGAAVAYLLWHMGKLPAAKLVLCPPHLVEKWRDELIATVPDVEVHIAETVDGLRQLARRVRTGRTKRPLFVVLSREKAKLGYGWKPVTAKRWWIIDGVLQRTDQGEPKQVDCCSSCFTPLLDKEGMPLSQAELTRHQRKCERCGNALWTSTKGRDKKAKQALAEFIHDRMPGFFDMLLLDEAHEYKGEGSAQGICAALLGGACGRVMALTGTLLGGYASTLFYLLYRFSPEVRSEFSFKDLQRWIQRYGFLEKITKSARDDDYESGRRSKRKSKTVTYKELPRVTPAILYELIANTVFVRLPDVAKDLPAYSEHIEIVPMLGAELNDRDPMREGTQAACYERLQEQLHAAVKDALARGSKRLLGAYLQALLGWPDGCTRAETVIDRIKGEVIGSAPALPADVIYPKERKIIDRIKAEKAEGRRTCVYWTHTGKRDAMERFAALCQAEGLNVAVLRSGSPKPEKRMAWINRKVAEGADVLLTNPRLVQTGLDLLDFPTIVWAECDYSTFVLRQASRRSWRIGQTRPVRIYFMMYDGTLQVSALSLIAAKLRASLMVEGDLGSDGLAAFATDGDDLMVALAKKLASGDKFDARSLEALFASNRDAEAIDESLLVADGWDSVEVDTAPVEIPAPVEVAAIAEAPVRPIDRAMLELPLFSHVGDGAITGAVALLPRRRVGVRVKRALAAGQLDMFGDAA